MQNIRYYRTALDNIFSETQELRRSVKILNNEQERLSFNSSIEINNVSFSYDKESQLLNNLNFKII